MKHKLLIYSLVAIILTSFLPTNFVMTKTPTVTHENHDAENYQMTRNRSKLSTPSGIVASYKDDAILIGWNSVTDAVGYSLFRRKNGTEQYMAIAYVSGSSSHYIDRLVEKKCSYEYKIVAKASEGAFDSEPGYLQGSVSVPIAKPTKLKGKVHGFYLQISFGKVKSAVQYEIYRSRKANGKYQLIGKTTKTSFLDKKIKPKKKYYYKVRARSSKKSTKYRSEYTDYIKVKAGRLDPKKPVIALTFDDGPSAYTSMILEELEKHHAKATFFVVGNRVKRYEKQLKEIHDAGCEIGNHSYSHPNLGISSKKKIKSQLDKTDRLVKKIVGSKPKLIRPPYGNVNKNLVSVSKRPLILWNVDTLDWKSRNADKVYNHVMSHLHDGNIVLMHDVYESSAKAAVRIIRQLDKKGYQMVTVSELAVCRNQKMKAGKKYFSFMK